MTQNLMNRLGIYHICCGVFSWPKSTDLYGFNEETRRALSITTNYTDLFQWKSIEFNCLPKTRKLTDFRKSTRNPSKIRQIFMFVASWSLSPIIGISINERPIIIPN